MNMTTPWYEENRWYVRLMKLAHDMAMEGRGEEAQELRMAADEIERLTAERDEHFRWRGVLADKLFDREAEISELRRQLVEADRRFDWLAERLEAVQIDNADPNDHYLDGEEDVPYTVLWRRAIDAVMGLTRPAEE